jgi:archaellum component FlaC
MENINYQETIVIPTLQRKLQELTNANLVFEISLLVEQTKNKDMQSFYTSRVNNRNVEDELASKDRLVTNIKNDVKTLTDELASKDRLVTNIKNDVKTLTNELNMIKSSLKQEISLKESIIEEYKQYCNKNTEDSMIKEKLVNINNDEIKTLADELNAIKFSLKRETSLKESVLIEYNTLKNKYDSLVEENSQLQLTQKKPKKKQEQLAEVLDGETY